MSDEEAVILYDKYYKNAPGAESLYKYDYSSNLLTIYDNNI